MEKTKLGISVALISMLCFFTGFMNSTACIILFVAVLVWSDSRAAKVNATQAVVLSVVFDILSYVFNTLSSSYNNIIDTIFRFIPYSEAAQKVEDWLVTIDIMGAIAGLITFIEFVTMIILVILCLKNKEIKLPIIGKLANKHFEETKNEEVVKTEPVVEETEEVKPVKKTTRRTKKATAEETK